MLYGIERFPTASDDGGITTITLPEATVALGAGTVTLDVTLPAGHEFNDTAPFSVRWTGTPGVVDPPEGADVSTPAPRFPLAVPMTFGAGSGTLTGDMTVYFCREGALALCLIDRVRLEIPVSVTPGAATDVLVAYTVPRPVG